jgi:predicted  nucleic acid-binding Zn-ribbon protein
LFFAVVAVAQAADSNPLGKVIELLDGLAAKVTADGEREAKAYGEYMEWCDDVSKNTGFEIKTAKAQKAKLEATIDDLSAKIEAGSSKIEELAGAIAQADTELTDATTVRDKESADFVAAEKELVDVIDTLDRAVGILQREMAKNPAALAQIDQTSMASMLQSLSVVVDAAAFSSSDKKKLMALVQSQNEDGELGAPAAAVYKTHSTGIFDLLEDLKEKAEGELSDLRKAETNAAHNYAMLKQSLEDQMAADNKDKKEEEANKAAAEEGKAGAEGDLVVTTKELKAAEEKLATAQANCMTVAADHEATVASRKEELGVIAEARKILVDTSSGAVEQTYSLFQASSTLRTSADLARSEVVTIVKRLAAQQHSAALAQLASRITAVVRYGGDDVFAKIKGLISDMIAKLEKQAQEEATEKAYCDEQLAKTEAKKSDLDDDIAKLTSKIDQATAKSASLKDDVKELQSELAALAKEQAEMDKIRQENHANYVQAKADLELGLSGVRKALGVLRDYYGSDGAAMLQQPEPPVPEKFSAAGGAASSIIGILEVCESDFAKNLATTESAEADEASAYDKQTQENKVTKTTKDQDVKYKSQEAASLDKNIAELSSDRDTANTELDAVMEYYGKIKERCIAKPETYEQRKARRQAEIEGLKQALSILENDTAFVQRKRRHVRGSLAL